MGKRIFVVSSARLRAFYYDGQLSEPYDFLANEEGLTNFSLYLEQPSLDPVYVLVDLVEEEFREDTIPHVFGGDRRALVRTKLNRIFRDATYSHALFQGRQSEGRRDDKVLFTALIRPDLIAPWMSQLSKHKVPVAGVYSLPLVSDGLRKLIGADSDYALVVTLQSSGGLRQTYFHEGKLKVSRLATLPDASPERYTAYLLAEIEKVRRYLNSLRLLPTDEALDVYIVGSDRVRAEVARHSPTSITTRFHVLTLPEVARKAGIKRRYQSRFSDRIYAHLLARRSPPNQYAPQAQTRYYRLHQTRKVLVAASVVLLIGSLGWSAALFVEGLNSIRESESARRQASFYEERYERARGRLPSTPAETRILKRVVEAADSLRVFETTPTRMMHVLSTGLDEFPQVELERIDWRVSADPEAVLPGEGAPPVARRARGEPQAGERILYQIAHVQARIAPFTGDYREALATVRRFAQRLRELPDVEQVRVESMPLDIGPDAQLQGDAEQVGDQARAEFALRVAVRDREGSGETG